MNRLSRDGLLTVSSSRQLQLTTEGRRKATEVMRKHRLAERLLTDVIGMDWQYVHEEACRWEHVMSDRVAKQLEAVLGDVSYDPYGNPIPSMVEGPAGPGCGGVRSGCTRIPDAHGKYHGDTPTHRRAAPGRR